MTSKKHPVHALKLGVWLSAALVGFASAPAAFANGATSQQEINPGGGKLADASDGLRWMIGSNSQLQVWLGDQWQVYGDNRTLADGGTASTPLKGPLYNSVALRVTEPSLPNEYRAWNSSDFTGGTFDKLTQKTQSSISGSGSASDPWKVITELTPNSISVSPSGDPNYDSIKITITDSYIDKQLWLTRTIALSELPTDKGTFQLYQLLDTLLQGGDNGPGFVRSSPENTTPSTPDYVGVVKGKQFETIAHDFSAGTPLWDKYFTGSYYDPYSLISKGKGDLDNKVDTSLATDNGLAVQWNVPAGQTSFTVQYRIAFANESVDLTKSFTPTKIKTGEVSTLTFNLANRSYDAPSSDVGFTDMLPAGLVVAPTPNIQTNCPSGGVMAAPVSPATVNAAANATSIEVSGISVDKAPSAGSETSCQISVAVTSAKAGTYNNTHANITNTAGLVNLVTDVPLEVIARGIQANPDAAAVTVGTSDVVAVADVLANDLFEGGDASLVRNLLETESPPTIRATASNPAMVLDPSTGAVTVKANTPSGVQTLDYQICEIASPTNCAKAQVSVTVTASDPGGSNPGGGGTNPGGGGTNPGGGGTNPGGGGSANATPVPVDNPLALWGLSAGVLAFMLHRRRKQVV